MNAPTFFIEEPGDGVFRLGMRSPRGRGPSLVEIFEDDGDLRFFTDEFEGDVRVPIEMLPGIQQALEKIAAERADPPSIAEDLREPEPGRFEVAEIIPWLTGQAGDSDDNALSGMYDRYLSGDASVPQILGEAFLLGRKGRARAAVREALAELRASLFGTLPGASTAAAISGPVIAAAIDRLAERFKP